MKTIKAKSLSIWNSHHLSVDTFPWNALTLPDSASFGFLLALTILFNTFYSPTGFTSSIQFRFGETESPGIPQQLANVALLLLRIPSLLLRGLVSHL